MSVFFLRKSKFRTRYFHFSDRNTIEHGDFPLEINSIRSIYINKFRFVLDLWLFGYLSGILGI